MAGIERTSFESVSAVCTRSGKTGRISAHRRRVREDLVLLSEMFVKLQDGRDVPTPKRKTPVAGTEDTENISTPVPKTPPARVCIWARRTGTGNAPVAVVGRTPDGDDRLVEHELVALHRELVRTRDEIDSVPVREHLHDISAKEIAGPAWGEAPADDI